MTAAAIYRHDRRQHLEPWTDPGVT